MLLILFYLDINMYVENRLFILILYTDFSRLFSRLFVFCWKNQIRVLTFRFVFSIEYQDIF